MHKRRRRSYAAFTCGKEDLLYRTHKQGREPKSHKLFMEGVVWHEEVRVEFMQHV